MFPKLRILYETWMVNGPFTYTLSPKQRTGVDLDQSRLEWDPYRFNSEIIQVLWNRQRTGWLRDDAVWDEENEEDNEFETDSKGEEEQ